MGLVVLEIFFELMWHIVSFLFALWMTYAARELFLDYISPRWRLSEISTMLPPTCYIRPPAKRSYEQ
ncbi:uncharacterized protein NEMAJ01_0016 [Nematocida major]|uniref:uncharacterized protein n=1 Tax=Nematocida major TaxID=1912982 RepID=UPI0020084AAF|nr:uncharacterized protein NEMAJ01_0016 [Nematocida major]KAH9385120.1 hypothetical protein NEMAJ01_0016 [Nematocida major]